jgi:hypothetical protein
MSTINVSSFVHLSESNHLLIIDLGVTNHVVKDKGVLVEFQRISHGTRWIYIGNNSKVDVREIGTCILVMHAGRTLILHNMLYVLDIC